MASVSGSAMAASVSSARAFYPEQRAALSFTRSSKCKAARSPLLISQRACLKQFNDRVSSKPIQCEAKYAAAALQVGQVGQVGQDSNEVSFEAIPFTKQRIFGSLFHHHQNPTQPPTLTENEASPPEASQPATPSPTESNITSFLLDLLNKAWKPALVALLLAAVLWYTPGDALAASSGGRAGGSNFSASRARSYSAPSQSYSAPSRSYSGPSYSAPSYSAPYFAPSPFYGGWGWSPFAPTVVIGGGGGGGGIFNLVFFGIIAYFLVTSVLSFIGQSQEEEIWEATQRSSVARLQVGLMGSARQLQKDLERMATRADTNTPEGLHYVLQESVLSLLRNPDYCIYGYSTSEVAKDSYAGEQAFNRLSMEERSKFREETLVNVGNVQKRNQRNMSSVPGGSEYIVVTIIAATEGELRLPEIRSAADLRSALTTLGSISADDLQAVEILWTPENENDTLTTKDMLQDYPLLRPL